MTLEQVQQHQQRKQQSLLEEQVQLEQHQRMRQQRELQLELAKHRNAILEQQQQQNLLAQVQRKEQEEEQEQEQQQQENERRAAEKRIAEGLDLSAVQPELAAEQDTADETRTRPQFVATRHRSMFGYRGPEQKMEQGNELKEKNREEREEEEDQVSTKPRRIPFMITAESRVRLTLLDYTPKQIDAMTPQQAQAILSPVKQQEREQSEPQVDQAMAKEEKEDVVHEEEEHVLDMSRIVTDADNYTAHAVDVMATKHGRRHVSSSSSPSSRRPSGSSSSSSSSPASLS
ncbi:hypothetical protein BGZ58_009997 [Dissophora ornata]|nr:hypothetical protein BGZ58_009997 [Dissophora ornata]